MRDRRYPATVSPAEPLNLGCSHALQAPTQGTCLKGVQAAAGQRRKARHDRRARARGRPGPPSRIQRGAERHCWCCAAATCLLPATSIKRSMRCDGQTGQSPCRLAEKATGTTDIHSVPHSETVQKLLRISCTQLVTQRSAAGKARQGVRGVDVAPRLRAQCAGRVHHQRLLAPGVARQGAQEAQEASQPRRRLRQACSGHERRRCQQLHSLAVHLHPGNTLQNAAWPLQPSMSPQHEPPCFCKALCDIP